MQKSNPIQIFRWVDQCPRRPHDVNRRTDEYQFVGQNYAWRSKTTDTQEPEILTMLIDNWYNEVRMNEEIHFLWPQVKNQC